MPGRSAALDPTLDTPGATRLPVEHVATVVVAVIRVPRPHEGLRMVPLGSQAGSEALTIPTGDFRALVRSLIGRGRIVNDQQQLEMYLQWKAQRSGTRQRNVIIVPKWDRSDAVYRHVQLVRRNMLIVRLIV